MGVVISKCCSRFNPSTHEYEEVNKPTAIKLKLQLNLTKVVYPRPDDTYVLFLFCSRDIQQHAKLNSSFVIERNKSTSQDFCISVDPTVPEFLHLWLFATSADSDKLVSQSLLATGKLQMSTVLNFRAPTAVSLVDITNTKQAAVTVLLLSRSSLLTDLVTVQQPKRSIQPLADKYIQQIYSGYESTSYSHDQKFAYVDTHAGRLPIISWSILATTVQAHPSDAAGLFNHFMRIAAVTLGVNLGRIDSLPVNVKLEIIGEMLTLIPRALIYVPDFVRTGSETIKQVDHWTVLSSYPNLGLAAFDCEDSAKQILELFTLFKHTQLSEERELISLQTLVRAYTGFMCLGILNLEAGRTPHCYVVLLDTNYVNHVLLGGSSVKHSYQPGLVLEGTNYTESVWIDNKSEEGVDHYKQLRGLVTPTDKYSRVLKFKMPHASIINEKMYGPITALLTGDHTNKLGAREALFLLVGTGSPLKVGAEIVDLMYYKNVAVKTVLKMDQSAIDTVIRTFLLEFPPSAIPVAPSKAGSFNKFTKPDFFLRSVDATHLALGLNNTPVTKYEMPLCVSHGQTLRITCASVQ